MDDFTALTDDSTDEFLVHCHGNNAWNVWLVVLTRSRDSLVDDVQYVKPSFLSLLQCLLQNFVRKTVALDVHLSGCDTVHGTGHLEVHVAQVVFVTQDVAQHGVLHVTLVGDKTHGDSGYRAFHLHTCVQQCQATAAHCGHRR